MKEPKVTYSVEYPDSPADTVVVKRGVYTSALMSIRPRRADGVTIIYPGKSSLELNWGDVETLLGMLMVLSIHDKGMELPSEIRAFKSVYKGKQ